MAVDENGIEIPDVANSSQSQKFFFNNKEFSSVEEVQQEAREMEHSIKSAYDRKLAEERQARIQAEADDVNFYSTHDPSMWDDYEPKLKGGRGYVGDGTVKAPAGKPNTPEAPAFIDSTRVLEERLKALETELTSLKQTDGEKARIAAINAREANKAKYFYADTKAVTDAMEKHFLLNNAHPTPEQVTQIMEQSHKRTLDLVNKAKGEKPADAPPPPVVKGGGSPGTEQGKRPSLSKDPEGFKQHVASKLQSLFIEKD